MNKLRLLEKGKGSLQAERRVKNIGLPDSVLLVLLATSTPFFIPQSAIAAETSFARLSSLLAATPEGG